MFWIITLLVFWDVNHLNLIQSRDLHFIGKFFYSFVISYSLFHPIDKFRQDFQWLQRSNFTIPIWILTSVFQLSVSTASFQIYCHSPYIFKYYFQIFTRCLSSFSKKYLFLIFGMFMCTVVRWRLLHTPATPWGDYVSRYTAPSCISSSIFGMPFHIFISILMFVLND